MNDTFREAAYKINLRESNTHWTLRTKIKRGLWNCAWIFLFRPTPKRIGNPWRLWLLRRFGAVVHGSALVHQTCKILQPWQLEIGDGSAVGHQVEIYNYALVSIGAMTVVSQYSYLCTGTHDYMDPHMPLTWKPITIGAQCWVAASVFVGPGVSVGDGAVIGARSVVTRDVPPWTVCAGNPCHPIKPRLVRESSVVRPAVHSTS
jgi:putative colanic acid biosynthesis acetyltransferase WcaF